MFVCYALFFNIFICTSLLAVDITYFSKNSKSYTYWNENHTRQYLELFEDDSLGEEHVELIKKLIQTISDQIKFLSESDVFKNYEIGILCGDYYIINRFDYQEYQKHKIKYYGNISKLLPILENIKDDFLLTKVMTYKQTYDSYFNVLHSIINNFEKDYPVSFGYVELSNNNKLPDDALAIRLVHYSILIVQDIIGGILGNTQSTEELSKLLDKEINNWHKFYEREEIH